MGVSPALSAVLSTSPHRSESSISAIAPRREFATASCNAARKCEKRYCPPRRRRSFPVSALSMSSRGTMSSSPDGSSSADALTQRRNAAKSRQSSFFHRNPSTISSSASMSGSAQTSAHSVPAAASRLDSALCPASAHSAQEKARYQRDGRDLDDRHDSVSGRSVSNSTRSQKSKRSESAGSSIAQPTSTAASSRRSESASSLFFEQRRHGAHAQAQRRKLDKQLHPKIRTGS